MSKKKKKSRPPFPHGNTFEVAEGPVDLSHFLVTDKSLPEQMPIGWVCSHGPCSATAGPLPGYEAHAAFGQHNREVHIPRGDPYSILHPLHIYARDADILTPPTTLRDVDNLFSGDALMHLAQELGRHGRT